MPDSLAAEFDAIHRTVSAIPALSDHEHHLPDAFFLDAVSLDRLLAASYVAWTGRVPDGSPASRADLLDHVRFNSYFAWFERGLQAVHGFDDPVTVESWDAVSDTVAAAYAAATDFHWRTLLDHGYRRLILDAYWDPGDDGGHPEAFTPAFRIDKFMYGFHPDSVAPDDFIPWQRYGFSGGSLDDYVDLMRSIIRDRHAAGRVACLKCAEAYNRSIDFAVDDPDVARAAFGVPPDRITDAQRVAFGNFIFHRACEIARDLDVPFQVHTGLAQLSGSNPMLLEPILARYPEVRFVLFHSGFPWISEAAGLHHNYPNALPSLTWTATICTSAAVRALDDFIDVAPSIRSITWGSDCWVAEESVGALLAWRWIVARVLAQRVADGRLRPADVDPLASRLLHDNVRHVYAVG